MDKSLTSNYSVQQFSNLLVKVISTLRQVQSYAKTCQPEIANSNLDCLKTFEYVSSHLAKFDISKLVSQIPSLCSPSSAEPLSITVIQKKKGFIIPWKIIYICFILEQCQNVNQFQEKMMGMNIKPKKGDAVFNESNLISGKGLYLRGILQVANKNIDAEEQFKNTNEQSISSIVADFIERFQQYKLSLQLANFEQLAEKMKKDDYSLFQKHPQIKVVWGEKREDNKHFQEIFEKQLGFVYFVHTIYEYQFMNESNDDNVLIIMSVEFALSKQDEQKNFLQYVSNTIQECKRDKSSVVLFSSNHDFQASKTSFESIKHQFPLIQESGNDQNFLFKHLIEIFQKDEVLQFKNSKKSSLPKRNDINQGSLILWGDQNKNDQNLDYYNRLREKFKEQTVLQIFNTSEMRRIPLENPNKIHIVVMSSLFSSDTKNNISNLNWCQQAILEYDLNCTHLILFTSENSIERNKWDQEFQKKHPNILITTKYKELEDLISKENFLNQTH
ncbi:hypothetical protein ABPG74_002499 [Tetrahymena malaccensis]